MIEVVTNELVRNLSFRDRRAYGETGFFHPLTLSLALSLSLWILGNCGFIAFGGGESVVCVFVGSSDALMPVRTCIVLPDGILTFF